MEIRSLYFPVERYATKLPRISLSPFFLSLLFLVGGDVIDWAAKLFYVTEITIPRSFPVLLRSFHVDALGRRAYVFGALSLQTSATAGLRVALFSSFLSRYSFIFFYVCV